MTAELKAVAFDADGTLFDSFRVIHTAYGYLADEYGYERPTTAKVRSLMHLTIPQIIDGLFPGCNTETLFNANEEFMRDRSAHFGLFPGAVELLEGVNELGLTCAIVTSGSALIEKRIAHHGLGTYFHSVVHGDRVKAHKPHPEGLLLALQECGVMPGEAVMIGDTVADIGAGKRAGTRAQIGVSFGFGRVEELETAGADFIVDNLADIRPIIETLQ